MRQEITEATAKWRGLVSEQTQSGLSVAAFCKQRGLRAWDFYEWKVRVSTAAILVSAMRSREVINCED
jgi:hypothetical protein